MAALLCRSLLLTLTVILCIIHVPSSALTGAVDGGSRRQTTTLFRPLRRAVRNFDRERTASVTLVFQRGDVTPRMRWFRQVQPNTLPNAEIPDMITVDGDSRYSVRTLSSHDVTAATLIIQPLDVADEDYPVKFVTLFSVDDEPFQYQVDTKIQRATVLSVDSLDGIVWVRSPPANTTFSPRGTLSLTCAVNMESASSSRFTDELNIYRSYLDSGQSGGRGRSGQTWTRGRGQPQLMNANCGKIHEHRDKNYLEQAGKYTFQGHLEQVPGSRGNIYQVSFRVVNGTQDDAGVYTCVGEREMDRTFVSTWVHLPQGPSPPVMLFLPCNDVTSADNAATGSSASRPYRVVATVGRPTCVRCRVYVSRPLPITLTKNDQRVVRSTDTMVLDWHLNVADGALSELTVNFLRPSASHDAALYSCTARNRHGRRTIYFRLDVL